MYYQLFSKSYRIYAVDVGHDTPEAMNGIFHLTVVIMMVIDMISNWLPVDTFSKKINEINDSSTKTGSINDILHA